jgi:hypothetical protein
MIKSKVLTQEEAFGALCPADLGLLFNMQLLTIPKTQATEGAPGSDGAVYPFNVTALVPVLGCVSRHGGDLSSDVYEIHSIREPGARIWIWIWIWIWR